MAFTVATSNSASAWRPDTYSFLAADVLPDALILQCSTVAGEIIGDAPSLKVAYITDDDADFVSEGSPIPEGDPTLSEAVVFSSKVSKLLRITSEQYRQAGTPAQLAASAARAVTRKADQAFISQAAPVGPAVAPSAGLLNVAGIVDGGAVGTNLDALVDLIAELQVNLADPSHLVVGPLAWSELRKFKESSVANNVSLVGAGVEDAQQRLLSLPVIVTNAITDYAGLVLDRKAVVSAVGAVEVASSKDAFFTSDSIAHRVLWRIGHTVPRPERIGKFSVTPLGS